MESELQGELDDILRELLREPGVMAAGLVPPGGALSVATELPVRSVALDANVALLVATTEEPTPALEVAIDRARRSAAACVLAHPGEPPFLELAGRIPRTKAALVARIVRLLEALGARTAICRLRTTVIATSGVASEEELARLSFLCKRVGAEAARLRGKSSHADIVADDVFAMSFWFDAYLVLFFEREWSEDFVRHRAHKVAREIAGILPHLDDDPTTPVQVRPVPPRS